MRRRRIVATSLEVSGDTGIGARGSLDAVVVFFDIIITGSFARRIRRMASSLFQGVDEAFTECGLGGAHHGDKKEEDCLVLHC